MISDSAYIEIMKNCSKWNGRILNGRQRSDTNVFDQQTGTVQRPTDYLHRTYTERTLPKDPMQVVCYPPSRWVKSPEISSDAIEMKYMMQDPALNEAIVALSNPSGNHIASSTEYHLAPDQSTPIRTFVSKYETSELDSLMYDDEEPENDPSDHEDDWGAKQKRRKKNNLGGASGLAHKTGGRGRSMGGGGNGGGSFLATSSTPAGGGAAGAEPRPFICQVCGAKYKSRPGLTYHRIHVHGAESTQSPKSPIISPSVDVSNYCDFCLGGKNRNAKGRAEELVTCHDCGRSGHPTCLNFTKNMVISTKKHGWQCIECKSCAICGTSENDDKLLFCDDCDRGFHLYCLIPPLSSPPETDWSCDLCQTEFGSKASFHGKLHLSNL